MFAVKVLAYTIDATALSMVTLGMTILNIATFSIVILGILILSGAILSIIKNWHYDTQNSYSQHNNA